jgi:hypothetical protein
MSDKSKVTAQHAELARQVNVIDLVPGASPVRCSFCGEQSDKVFCMIAGPRGVAICDRCIEVCADQVAKRRAGGKADLCNKG